MRGSRSWNTSTREPDDKSHTAELGRTAARGTTYHAAAQGISLGSGYVVAIVLARWLGDELYGVYGVVISVLVAVELIGRLGIPQATSRLVAEVKSEHRAVESTSITLTALTFLGIAAAFIAAAPLLARVFEVEDGARLFRIAGLDIPFYGMFFCLQHILNGQRRFASEGLGVSFYGVSKALGVLSLIAVGVTVERALLVNIGASVLGCAWFASRLSWRKFRPSLAAARPILHIAMPTALFILGSQVLQNLDLWFLKWTSREIPEQTIGHYVAANGIARLPSVAHFVMIAVLLPTVSRAASAGDRAMVARLVRGALRLLLLVMLPACGYLALRSEPLMELVYSGRYPAGAEEQSLLVLRHGIFGVFLLTACSVLIALGEQRRAAREVLQLVPLSVLLNALLVRAQGTEGAALAALSTSAVGAFLALLVVRARVGPLGVWGALARSLLATALLLGVLSLWTPRSGWLVLELAIAVPVHATLLILLGAVSLEELLSHLREPFRRR